jgi:2-polyprenyl-6-methoxyphenol hydroxylase-like FAD-dependent oxidoreductase
VTLPAQTVKRSLMSHCNEIRFGRTVRRIEPSRGQKGGAVVHLDNGETDWADVVVGADGLHSTVRRLIYTAENQDQSLASHNMMQVDGFARREDFSPFLGVNPCEFWGAGRVFSYYPHIATSGSNTLPAAGSKPTNILSFSATLFHAPKEVANLGADLVQMQPALRELLCREFEAFGPEVTQLFRDAALLRPAELLRVPIMPHWHHRRAVLLGDAAHGTFPSYLQQDASLAVEDAAILATVLATLPLKNDRGFEYGFRKYEKARRYRVEQYHRQSQQVRDFAARDSLIGVRDAALRVTPGAAASRLLQWMSSWSYKGREAEADIEGGEDVGR